MKERPILFNTAMVQAILAGHKTQTRRAVNPQPSTEHNWHGWIIESTCRNDEGKACWAIGESPLLNKPHRVRPPFGKVGDRLWVREAWHDVHPLQAAGRFSKEGRAGIPAMNENYRTIYKADGDYPPIWHCENYPFRTLDKSQSTFPDWDQPKGVSFGWRPSIHMPRWACRIILEVTGLRVERLQDISESDAVAEGLNKPIYIKNESGQLTPPPGETLLSAFPTAKHWFSTVWNGVYENWSVNPWVWVVEFKVLTTNGVLPEVVA